MMTPSREDIEFLWAASARVHEQNQRRENCTLWILHHERLAKVFRGHADHHAREQERYQRILTEESEDAEQA